MTDKLKELKIKTGVAKRTWKDQLSYKKEYENEKRKVEKMIADKRDEYDLKKAVDTYFSFFLIFCLFSSCSKKFSKKRKEWSRIRKVRLLNHGMIFKMFT